MYKLLFFPLLLLGVAAIELIIGKTLTISIWGCANPIALYDSIMPKVLMGAGLFCMWWRELMIKKKGAAIQQDIVHTVVFYRMGTSIVWMVISYLYSGESCMLNPGIPGFFYLYLH